LKAILALGYQIVDPQEDIHSREIRIGACRAQMRQAVSDPELTLRDLARLFEKSPPENWGNDFSIFETMAKRAIDIGETPLSLEILAAAEKAHPSNPAFLYLRALAFAQSYDFSGVRELLRQFFDTPAFTELTPKLRVDFLSLMGWTFKDEWLETAKESPPRKLC